MAPVIRHKQRFNRSNALGGAGSPQAYDEPHEIEGQFDIADIKDLPAALKAHTDGLTGHANALEALGVELDQLGDQIEPAALVARLEGIAADLPRLLPAAPGKLWMRGDVLSVSSPYGASLALGDRVSIGSQDYVAIGPTPLGAYAIRPTVYAGEPGWWRMEVRQGERPVGDSLLVDRIGLDGWVDPLGYDQANREFEISFSYVPGENAQANGPGFWHSIFELHAIQKNEHSFAGPIRMLSEWSTAKGKQVFRIWRSWLLVDPPASSADYGSELLFEGSMQIGQRYDFTVRFRPHPEKGFISFDMNGIRIVDADDGFGYGYRQLYPQFRFYRATEARSAWSLWKIGQVTSTALPLLPPGPGLDQIAAGGALRHWWVAHPDAVVTADGKVTHWIDQHGAIPLMQTNAAKRPAFDPTGWNGVPALSFDGVDDFLELAPSPLPSGAEPYEVWVLCEDLEPGSNTAQRTAFSTGGDAVSRRSIFSAPSSGANKIRVGGGTGSTQPLATDLALTFAGRSAVRAVFSATGVAVSTNQSALVTVAGVPATGEGNLRIGASLSFVPQYFWHGPIREILVTSVLNEDQAAALWTYVLGRLAP